MGLKSRFRKDKKFFLGYLKIMDNLVASGIGISVMCLIAVQYTKESLSTRKYYKVQTWQIKSLLLWKDFVKKNCLHDRCRSHVLSSPSLKTSAVVVEAPLLGEPWYGKGASALCNVCLYVWCNIVRHLLKIYLWRSAAQNGDIAASAS